MKTKYIIFDLDDTLFYEINYLRSAYKEIANEIGDSDEYEKMMSLYFLGQNVFEYLSRRYSVSVEQLVARYRSHIPEIQLNDGAAEILALCIKQNFKLGLITDGRSITQRNKLKSLKIEEFFDRIIISEEFGSTKPFEANFKAFMVDGDFDFFYIADNLSKDFITPNKLGWTTICLLDNGNNIHQQCFDNHKQEYLPKYKIVHLSEVRQLINATEDRISH